MRVALIGHNSVEYIEKLLEIWNNNNSAVLLDYDFPNTVIRQIFEKTEVGCCIIEDSLLSLYDGNISTNVIVYSVKQKLPCTLPDTVRSKFIPRYDESEAVVIFSSGTTGISKGISLSHRAINNNADSIIDYMRPIKDDCLYLNKKLSHCSSLVGELLVALKAKTNILLSQIVVPPRVVFKNIDTYNVSILVCTPTLLKLYVDEANRTKHFPEKVKKVYTCGDSISSKDLNQARNTFRCAVYNVYGQSECGPRIAAQTEHYCKDNSVGKPIKNVDIRIDSSGEILIKSNSLFTGYTNFGIIPGEWHRTGDLGYFDANGELYITGRADNMIVIGGHNIYPETIENAIIENINIDDCLVYKDGDELGCIYSSQEEISFTLFTKVLKKLMMSYEIPQKYSKVDIIPHNRNGKKKRN